MPLNFCPLCSHQQLSDLLYKDHNALVSIAQIKPRPQDIPTSPIELVQCPACGYIFNRAFDRDKTLPVYASQDYIVKSIIPGRMSHTIEGIHNALAEFVGPETVILEIGSGQADIALALGKRAKKVVTMDPSVQMHLQNLPEGVNHTHIQKYFSYDTASAYGPYNLIFFRHLLEHIPDPQAFLQDVAKLTAPGGVVYIEVPNWDNVAEYERFCDIFNDHFGYYQEATLDQIMSKLGFSEVKATFNFGGQHMGLFFQKKPAQNYAPKQPKKYTSSDFEKIYTHGRRLNEIFDGITTSVVWGAGAHGESILSSLSPQNRNKIKYYFDKDKNKIGKFIPNTHAQIVHPDKNLLKDVNLVVISAVLYEDEIAKELLTDLGYAGPMLKIGHGVTVVN